MKKFAALLWALFIVTIGFSQGFDRTPYVKGGVNFSDCSNKLDSLAAASRDLIKALNGRMYSQYIAAHNGSDSVYGAIKNGNWNVVGLDRYDPAKHGKIMNWGPGKKSSEPLANYLKPGDLIILAGPDSLPVAKASCLNALMVFKCDCEEKVYSFGGFTAPRLGTMVVMRDSTPLIPVHQVIKPKPYVELFPTMGASSYKGNGLVGGRQNGVALGLQANVVVPRMGGSRIGIRMTTEFGYQEAIATDNSFVPIYHKVRRTGADVVIGKGFFADRLIVEGSAGIKVLNHAWLMPPCEHNIPQVNSIEVDFGLSARVDLLKSTNNLTGGIGAKASTNSGQVFAWLGVRLGQ